MHNLHRKMHPSSLRKRIPNCNLLWFHHRIGSFPLIGLDCDLADYQGNWQRFRVVEQDWSHDGSIPYCTFGRHAWRLSWFEGWNHLDFSNYETSSSYMEWPLRRFDNFWHLELHSMIRNQVNLKNIRFQFCQGVYSLIRERYENRDLWRLIIFSLVSWLSISWCPIFGQMSPKFKTDCIVLE